MEALFLILWHAPAAIVNSRFDVDKRSSIYGLPARLVGVLLLQIVAFAVVDVIYWLINRGKWDLPMWYGVMRLGLAFGGIIGSGLICIIFREKRRDK